MSLSLSLSLYIYIYIHMCIYIYICIYTHIHNMYVYYTYLTYLMLCYITQSDIAFCVRSISEISSCFFGPRPWHIEIRHRVTKNIHN